MTEAPAPEPASAFSHDALCEAFNAAFADNPGVMPALRREDWPVFVRRQGIDVELSRVVADGAKVDAFALVGRSGHRGGAIRLATMGARPAARGRGAAPLLLDGVLAEARVRGDLRIELEVFSRNARALALYRSRGFEPLAELHGWVRAPHAVRLGDDPAPQAVTAAAAAAWLDALALEGLPFQASGAAVAADPQALEAVRHGRAQVVVSVRDAANVSLVSFVDPSPAQDDGRLLLRALASSWPAATLRVAQIQRDDFGGRALEAEGFKRLEHGQLLMRLQRRG